MKSIFALLLSATYVAAHGYVHQVAIDGTIYPGNAPGATPSPSIIRQISTIDPVKGASNSNLNCGQNAQPASLVGNAMPGSTMSIYWGGNSLQVSFRSCRSFLSTQRAYLNPRQTGPTTLVQ